MKRTHQDEDYKYDQKIMKLNKMLTALSRFISRLT